MRHCKIPNVLFEAFPLKPWRDLLIRRHMERCPVCRARLAGRDEARRVLSKAEDFRGRMDLWPGIRDRMAASARTGRQTIPPRFGLARFAAAAALLVMAAGLSLLFFRGFTIAPQAPPRAAEERFEVNHIRIAGQPADSYLFQFRDLRMTLIWAEKKSKGGLS